MGIGSFSDPRDLQGLSHYLEHMLFMGSAAFPDENEYDAYLNKHGGCSNAYTELVRLHCCSACCRRWCSISVLVMHACMHRRQVHVVGHVTCWVACASAGMRLLSCAVCSHTCKEGNAPTAGHLPGCETVGTIPLLTTAGYWF